MNNKKILTMIVVALALMVVGYYFINKESSNTPKVDTVSVTEEEKISSANQGQVNTGTVKPVPSVTGTTNYIRIGQKVTLNDVSITPTKVSYDSRCPKDVKCIQAGSLDLSVLLEKGNLAQSLIITSGKPVVFGNRKITLTSILPTRLSTKTILEADYRFVFTVIK